MGSGSSYRGTRGTFEGYASRPAAPDMGEVRRARERAEREERDAAEARDAERTRTARAEADRRRRAEQEAVAETARRKVEDEARETARKDSVRAARERTKTAGPTPADRPKRDTTDLYDPALVRPRITRPHKDATGVTIALIDNSGSNAAVAQRIRESSGFILATMGLIVGRTQQFALLYGSDHCDEHNGGYRQDVDYVYPDEEGDRVMFSTTHNVRGADGRDEAEAWECLLSDACDIDFGHVPKAERHLILATDVVGHGMGMVSDDGCPRNRNWKDSVRRVYETYETFEVIGTGRTHNMARMQAQFLREERVPYDLLDFSAIREDTHRLGIIPNAILFLMARKAGEQTTRRFLQFLYHKWLVDPIFGQNTDLRAREAIVRFLRFIEGMDDAKQAAWEEEILVD